ncbi:MAG: hypothetical protein AB8G05_17420 [Oligoflexales bacterium]
MFDINDEKIIEKAAKLLREYAPPFKKFGSSAVMLSASEIADHLMMNSNLSKKHYKDRICGILRKQDNFSITVDDFFLIAWVTGLPLVQVFSHITSLSDELSLELLRRVDKKKHLHFFENAVNLLAADRARVDFRQI